MQFVFLDLLLKEHNSFLIKSILIFEGFNNTISDAINLLEVVNFAVAFIN